MLQPQPVLRRTGAQEVEGREAIENPQPLIPIRTCGQHRDADDPNPIKLTVNGQLQEHASLHAIDFLCVASGSRVYLFYYGVLLELMCQWFESKGATMSSVRVAFLKSKGAWTPRQQQRRLPAKVWSAALVAFTGRVQLMHAGLSNNGTWNHCWEGTAQSHSHSRASNCTKL